MGTINSAPGRRAFETLGFLLREHVVTLDDKPAAAATKNATLATDLRRHLRDAGPSSVAVMGAAIGIDAKRVTTLLARDIYAGRVLVYRDARRAKPLLLLYALAPGVRA